MANLSSAFNMTDAMAIETSCDVSSNALLMVFCIVGLLVTFAGYRLYIMSLALFGFSLAFGTAGATGYAWMEEYEGHQTPKTLIVVAICLLWGALGAALCVKVHEQIQKTLGFLLGAGVGFAATFGAISVMIDIVDDSTFEGYDGWDTYVLAMLGVPLALLIGYLTRDSLKYLLMCGTALGGAAVAFKSLETVVLCSEVELGKIQTPSVEIMIVAGITGVGFCTQLFMQPKAEKQVEMGSNV